MDGLAKLFSKKLGQFIRDIAPKSETPASAPSNEHAGSTSYPSEKWQALVRYDPELSQAAEKLRPYGEKWVHILGRDYFALGEDRKYLRRIVLKLEQEAAHEEEKQKSEREANEFRQLYNGELCSEASLTILRQARAKGYNFHIRDSGTIEATKAGIGTTYFYSNSDIQAFGRYL